MVDKNAKKVGEKRPKLVEKAENSLINVIYVKINEENLVFLSTEYNEFDNTVLTLNWDLDTLKNTIRPWKILWKLHEDLYKPSIIPEFFEVAKQEETAPLEVYEPFSPAIYDTLEATAEELTSFGLIKVNQEYQKKRYSGLLYNCDIINKFEDLYGEKGSELIQEFATLDNKYINIVRGFYREITRSGKLNYLLAKLNGEPVDIIADFLPKWCKDEIKIFGDTSKIGENQTDLPECRKEGLVGEVDTEQIQQEMIDEIFSEFELGSVLRGSEIRTRFREIYAKYGLNPRATLSEFMKYFVIRKAKSEYEWYYRIMQRRDIELPSK